MSPPTRFDPDALASLESERDFLLRSIKDLESEREAGNLDEERYRALKDDYTARAAAVLRSIEEGRHAAAAAPPVPRKRKLLTGSAVLAFVLVAALALAAAAGKRHEGQTMTGNAQSGDPRRAALEKQVREHPDDPTARLDFARYLLEVQDWTAAVKEYLTAAKLDPKNPEANAYAGWMLFQAATNAEPTTKGELTSGALDRLDAAIAASDSYADAYFFRGMVKFRGAGDAKGAIPDFERFLALVPDGPLNAEVKAVLDQARQQAG
ncbi:MAG: tetratricopeptide repeat protein [Actinomycetota bacterium]